ERHRPLEDVAAGEIEGLLQRDGGQDLAVDYRLLDIRRILVDDVDAAVGILVAVRLPSSFLELVRRILRKHRHQMLARRRDAGVDRRGDRTLDDRVGGWAAI